jgi:DNA/RNA endonuclease YhcR with UshA esterase domain
MRSFKLLAAGVIVIGVAAAAYAQGGMRRGGNYNPATETTVTGTVDEVKNLPSPGRGGGGLHLVLSTGTGPIDVHVGPASFVASKNFAFAKGDSLTVIGSKVTLQGQEALIAREIKKGEQVLTLRDAKGFPLWSGRNRTR